MLPVGRPSHQRRRRGLPRLPRRPPVRSGLHRRGGGAVRHRPDPARSWVHGRVRDPAARLRRHASTRGRPRSDPGRPAVSRCRDGGRLLDQAHLTHHFKRFLGVTPAEPAAELFGGLVSAESTGASRRDVVNACSLSSSFGTSTSRKIRVLGSEFSKSPSASSSCHDPCGRRLGRRRRPFRRRRDAIEDLPAVVELLGNEEAGTRSTPTAHPVAVAAGTSKTCRSHPGPSYRSSLGSAATVTNDSLGGETGGHHLHVAAVVRRDVVEIVTDHHQPDPEAERSASACATIAAASTSRWIGPGGYKRMTRG